MIAAYYSNAMSQLTNLRIELARQLIEAQIEMETYRDNQFVCYECEGLKERRENIRLMKRSDDHLADSMKSLREMMNCFTEMTEIN